MTEKRILPLEDVAASTAALESAKVDRAGDTMTGALTVSGASVTASAFFGAPPPWTCTSTKPGMRYMPVASTS